MATETRYQRIAREQAERQAARAKRMEAAQPKRQRSKKRSGDWYISSGAGFFRDVDGYDRDNLGMSPDY